ncbi:MAG: hypothetical protein ACKOFJ_06095 [Actinomycetota bacterium]
MLPEVLLTEIRSSVAVSTNGVTALAFIDQKGSLVRSQYRPRSSLRAHYAFLYPLGHFGLMPVTFFLIVPLTQVIVFFIEVTTGLGVGEAGLFGFGDSVVVGVGEGDGEGELTTSGSVEILALIKGAENSKLEAFILSQPLLSLTDKVAV